MKISPQILSIPPYISTSWKNIASLHLENQSGEDVLVITLHSGARIEVPQLEVSLIETIFLAHIQYLELEEKPVVNKPVSKVPFGAPPSMGHFSLELLALDGSAADLNGFSALAHDPAQANSPKLPGDILSKISQIAQSMGIDDPQAFPAPESNCNCMRCQIAEAIQNSIRPKIEEVAQEETEEIVSDEELKFNTWNISQKEDKLYIVTNPLENTEQYQVHLGNPIGCTCGHDHCEHIRAVLNT